MCPIYNRRKLDSVIRVTPSFRLRRSLPKKHNDHKTYKILHFQAPDTLRATQGLYNKHQPLSHTCIHKHMP